MIKRLVLVFISTFFVFGPERAAAYDFKVCNENSIRINSFSVYTSLASCNNQQFNAVEPGQCVSGSTGDGCLVSKITLITPAPCNPQDRFSECGADTPLWIQWSAKQGAVDGGNWTLSGKDLCRVNSRGMRDCR